MSNALIIGPHENLIERTAGLLGPPGKDYSHSLVVFPGRRPAHFLRRELAQKGKGSFVPPLIMAMDDFVGYVTEAVHPVRNVETVDAIAILYQLHRSAPEPLGGEGFLTLDSFFPLGIRLFTDIEELHIEGVPPAMVKEIQPFTDELIPKHALARLQSLYFFYKTFYTRISELGMATRSMRYRIAAEKLLECGIERFEKVIFAGFYALTKSEKDLFRKLLRSEKAIFMFQDGPGLRERLMELEIEPGDAQRSQ
ncbi:MAG TPA: hypothetical protein VN328_04640, partial [Thermodesulfovibrionales bacterium]|nr:hypothetical protein [Thermodesulfovibrionales bacterium]